MRKYVKILVGFIRLFIEEVLSCFRIKLHGISYSINSGVKFWIYNKGKCDLGKKTWLSENCIIECNGGTVEIGYNNFFNSNCRLACLEYIKIGDNNLFGPNVIIVDHNHKYERKDIPICKQGFNSDPIIIGSDIWICGNVTICAGAKIDSHIVIAANSVVKGHLSQPGVYSGCPAKIKRSI